MKAPLQRLLTAPIAHRGLHGCGRRQPVENTIAAAEAAIARGYGIECDVRLSRDGEAMVFHDERLDRLTHGCGPLADVTAHDLARLAFREGADRMPRLATLLDTVAGRAPIVIEIKSNGDGDIRLARRTLALIAGHDVAVESFDPAVLAFCRRSGACCPLGLVGPANGDDSGEIPIDAVDFVSWNIEHLATGALFHPGLPLTAWTVRTMAQRARAARAGAQIVFEGFDPGDCSPSDAQGVNRDGDPIRS